MELSKTVLGQTATVSHTNTLGLFPVGKKKKQKFVVGDDSGVVSCFEMKKGEAQVKNRGGAITLNPIVQKF